jgi:hypothetical protein
MNEPGASESEEGGPDEPATEVVWLVESPDTGQFGLAAIVKRTYALRAGRLALADEQVSLVAEPEIEVDQDDVYRQLLDDSDLHAQKQATDVVVLGSAHARKRVKELHIAVAVDDFARRLRVMGERRAEIAADGSVRFSDPEPFESLELSYDHAYGGYDGHAHDVLDPPPKRPPNVDLPNHPFGPGLKTAVPEPRLRGCFAYPRNWAGAGYFIDVDRARAEGARLPRIEDPLDALTPDRFFVPSAAAWIDAPIPGSLGWVHHAWYPRCARLLGALYPRAVPSRPIREAALGDGDDLEREPLRELGKLHPRAIQGAAPGLARKRLRGDESIVLENLHPEIAELRFQLPGEAPRLTLRPPDIKAFTPKPVLQTVRIEPDQGRVSLVWCAVVPVAREFDADFLDKTDLSVAWSSL